MIWSPVPRLCINNVEAPRLKLNCKITSIVLQKILLRVIALKLPESDRCHSLSIADVNPYRDSGAEQHAI